MAERKKHLSERKKKFGRNPDKKPGNKTDKPTTSWNDATTSSNDANKATTSNNDKLCSITLTEYLNEYNKKKITPESVDEYKIIQRKCIDETCDLMREERYRFQLDRSVFVPVKIEHVESYHEFYVVQQHHLSIRNKVQDELARVNNDNPEPFDEIEINDICAVHWDDVWYRGMVKRISASKNTKSPRYTIRLIDFGQMIIAKTSQMRLLKGWPAQLGKLAFRCIFANLNTEYEYIDSNDSVREKIFFAFSSAVKEANISIVHVKQVIDDKKYGCVNEVYLIMDKGTEMKTIFNAYLLHEAYGAFVRPNIQFREEECVDWFQNNSGMCEPSKLSQFHKKFRVKVANPQSPSKFFVRCKVHVDLKRKLQKRINEYVDSYEATEKNQKKWTKKDRYCLVQLHGKWYRGRIINMMKYVCTVFFRDEGHQFTVVHESLIPIPDELAKPPDCVQQCHLDIVSGKWLKSNDVDFQKCIDEYKEFAVSTATKKGHATESVGVTLWAINEYPDLSFDERWHNIGAKITSQTILKSLEFFIVKSQYHYEEQLIKKLKPEYQREKQSDSYFEELLHWKNFMNVTDPDWTLFPKEEEEERLDGNENDQTFELDNTDAVFWIPPNDVGATVFEAAITNLSAKGIVHLQTAEDTFTADSIRKALNHHVKDTRANHQGKNAEWEEDDVCFAKPLYDENYFRGAIKSLDHLNDKCLVILVDYGVMVKCKISDLRPATKFGNIPILAHPYVLNNVIPSAKTGKWNSVLLKRCRSKIVSKYVFVSVIPTCQVQHNIPCCELDLQEGGENLFDWMRTERICSKIELDADNNPILFV